MNSEHTDWERRLSQLWAKLDGMEVPAFLSQMRQLTSERGDGDPAALFEMGAANDSTGFPEKAAVLYEQALQAGLSGIRRRRARIQMASSLRNLGQAQQAAAILADEMKQPSDELDQAVAAFLGITYGRYAAASKSMAVSSAS